jgi:hypothetical protein
MDILYHYCSTASFHAIVQSHSLWLSSLSLSNDTMEGKQIASAIARLAKKDELDEAHIRSLQDGIRFIEENIDGLGFCLSKESDLLSQWRGYAEDAAGVAIGFSTEYLNWLSETNTYLDQSRFTLQIVEYEPCAHEALVKPTYNQLIKAGVFKTPGLSGLFSLGDPDQDRRQRDTAIQEANEMLYLMFMPFIHQLFRLKARAFREECEWRLLSHLVKDGEEACLHRAVDSRIVPYRAVELVELARSPIAEVVLGPKHGTPPKIVEDFLKLNHYGTVKVRRSEASYR